MNDRIITNNITTRNGTTAHIFAFVYPSLKNNGICIPVMIEKINRDRLKPSKILDTSINISRNKDTIRETAITVTREIT